MKTVIGKRYELKTELGFGGMGIVHQALDRLTGEMVALKQVQIPTEYLQFMSRPQTTLVHDLRLALAHEFQTLASLSHPHIISVLDYGFSDEGQPYYTMNYLDQAQTLLQAGAKLSVNQKVILLQQTLQALAYLHRRGILHRDLKPENVLVVNKQVRLLDFGLSTPIKEATAEALGSWAYMAPEMIEEVPPSEASDLYVLGVLAYQLFAGQHPFAPLDYTFLDRMQDEEPDLSLLKVNEGIAVIIGQLLAKDPRVRYHRAAEVMMDLNQALGQVVPIENQAIRESYLQAATFVGRQPEMRLLNQALADAKKGRGSILLVGGESGVGKSRLLAEFRTQALVTGWRVITGQATADGGAPYIIWRDIIPHLILSSKLSNLEAGVLRTIAPNIDTLLGRDIPAPAELSGQANQQRLVLTLVDLLRRQKQATLLLLEDLQWVSESLIPLQILQHQISDTHLLVVGSYRNDEQAELPQELPGAQVLSLARLDKTAIAQLSQDMLGASIANRPEVINLLQKETEGNAFFLVEVVRALAEEAGQLAKVGQMRLPMSVFTGGMQHIIQRRLARVPLGHQPLLQLAAVAGREVDLDLLTYLSSAKNLIAWLDACQEAAVIEVKGGRWRFSHDKLREGVLFNLDDEMRPQLHRRVAEAIEQLYADDLTQAVVLARHWHTVGDDNKERHYAFIAGQQTAIQFDHKEAITHLSRALALIPPDDQTSYYNILLAREDVYYRAGNRSAQIKDLNTLSGLAADRGQSEKQVEVALRQATYNIVIGNYSEAITAIQQVTKLAHRTGNMSLETKGYHQWGKALWFQGLYNEARLILEESLTLSRQIGDQGGEGQVLLDLATVTAHIDEGYAESATLYKASLALSRQIGDRWTEGRALNNLGFLTLQQGAYDKARDYLVASLTLNRQVGNRKAEGITLLNLGIIAFNLGAYDKALSYYEPSLRLSRQTGDRQGEGIVLNNLGLVFWRQSAYEQAQTYFETGLELMRQIRHRRTEGIIFNNMGHLATDLENYKQAKSYYQQALTIRQALQMSQFVAEDQAGLAYMAIKQGQPYHTYLTGVLTYLVDKPQLAGAEHPFLVYLTCYHCLKAINDPQAKPLLRQAYNLLHERAIKIQDTDLRHSFLENVVEHKEIIQLCKALELDSKDKGSDK